MQKNSGKRKKRVALFSQEGTDITSMKLPGRRMCTCQATKHGLVTNCLSCGRIVCEQEGAGPCLFCGTMVGDGEAVAATAQKPSAALSRATQHKDMILERARAEQHSQVIDDESDYFQTGSSWLSSRQRKAIDSYRRQLEEARAARQRSYTIDFAGRQVTQQQETVEVDAAHLSALISELAVSDVGQPPAASDADASGSAGTVRPQFRPQYQPDQNREADVDALFRPRAEAHPQRVQDAALQLLADDGMCLSLHQPWASLLTAGIKIHEGRSWYTPHRGRLWIAAAAKPPVAEEIQRLQRFYCMRAGKELSFPEYYPTGCLLGRVNLVDCLPQEVYQEQYPDGESESPYVMICNDPEQLLVKFPMKGQHKIYKMDTTIHQAAKKMLAAS